MKYSILPIVLAVISIWCNFVLMGIYNIIAQTIILIAALWGIYRLAIEVYSGKRPIRICSYKLSNKDELLIGDGFAKTFYKVEFDKGKVIKIPREITSLYLELEPRKSNITIREINLRFKKEDDLTKPELVEFKDVVEPNSFTTVSTLEGQGITIRYMKGKEVYKNRKFYYGIRIRAKQKWSGKISLSFTTAEVGIKRSRKLFEVS